MSEDRVASITGTVEARAAMALADERRAKEEPR
jgi:hypothetical protein